METAARFFEHAQQKLQEVLEQEMPNIQAAAELVTRSCRQGGKFYVFGSGHSHMIAEELYLRAGGLALVCQVVDNLVKAGIEPPVFKSSNVDGGDEHNNRMFDTYYGYWK